MNTGEEDSGNEKMGKDYYVPYNMDLHIRRFSNKPKLSSLDFDLRMRIYDLLGITGEEDNYGDLRIFDQDEEESLILVHYLNLHPSVYHVRGTIFDISNPENPFVIASSFAYTEDILPSSLLQPERKFELSDNMYITKATEGTAIRIFQSSSGKWFTATHKKLRGENSKWAGPTFGELFKAVWGAQENFPFSDYLNSEMCHIFLLASPENRLVCRIPSPSLTLVGQFIPCENGRMKLSSDLDLLRKHENVVIQARARYDSVEDLIQDAKELNWETYTGILMACERENIMSCWKIVPKGYAKRRAIRGNEPNFILRYLQLRKGEEEGISFADMVGLFPEHSSLFRSIEKSLRKLPAHLKNLYFQRYREAGYVRMPGEEYHIIDYVFNNFNSQYSVLQNIKHQIERSNARQLNAMIKHMNKPERYYIYDRDK